MHVIFAYPGKFDALQTCTPRAVRCLAGVPALTSEHRPTDTDVDTNSHRVSQLQ